MVKMEVLAEKLFGVYSKPHLWFLHNERCLAYYRQNIIPIRNAGFGAVGFWGCLCENEEMEDNEFYRYKNPLYVESLMKVSKNLGIKVVGYLHAPKMAAMLKRSGRTVIDLFKWLEKSGWDGVLLDNAEISDNPDEIEHFVYMLKQILGGPIIHHQSVKPIYETVDDKVWYDFKWNRHMDYIKQGETNFTKPPAWWFKYCVSTVYNPYCDGLGLYFFPTEWYSNGHGDVERYMWKHMPEWYPLLSDMMLATIGSTTVRLDFLNQYYFPRYNELKTLYLTDPVKFFKFMPNFPDKMPYENKKVEVK